MNNLVFNTPFEFSLRILLILSIKPDVAFSIDLISAIDFISIYSASFGLEERNLHGNSGFKFSEYAARRTLVQNAVKLLLLTGMVSVTGSEKGFIYQITGKGLSIAISFETTYAINYRISANKAIAATEKVDETHLISFINNASIKLIQVGEKE